jgi:hypothetical protein
MPTDEPSESDQDEAGITLEHARTAIVRFLAERDEPVENLDLLTTAVRETEYTRRDRDIADFPYSVVYERVTTTHLPALDDEGLVSFNRAAETVSLCVSPDEFESDGSFE